MLQNAGRRVKLMRMATNKLKLVTEIIVISVMTHPLPGAYRRTLHHGVQFVNWHSRFLPEDGLLNNNGRKNYLRLPNSWGCIKTWTAWCGCLNKRYHFMIKSLDMHQSGVTWVIQIGWNNWLNIIPSSELKKFFNLGQKLSSPLFDVSGGVMSIFISK